MKQHDLGDLVGLPRPRYRRDEVEQLVGAPHDHLVRWWRAMGFAEIPEDEVAFTDDDVEMARRLMMLTGSGIIDDDAVLRMARLFGASFSRIAEAQAAQLDELATAGEDLPVELFAESMMYVWRRHLGAALGRWIDADEEHRELAVGFADVSGFSKLAKQLEPEELASVVDTFETAAFDVVSTHGGRVVKLIGDEVMFVADDVPTAVDIGLDLMDAVARLAVPVALHCGIASGPTVTVGGDVFGSTVNLASRLTDVARRGRLVLPREAARALESRPDLHVHRVRRAFDLKGFGRTRLVTVTRNADDGGDAGPAHSGDAADRGPTDAPDLG
jgi:adenylate cyclase